MGSQTCGITFLIRVESFPFIGFHWPFSHVTVKNKAKRPELPIQIELISTTYGVLALKFPRVVNHKSTIACHIEITSVWYFQYQQYLRLVHTARWKSHQFHVLLHFLCVDSPLKLWSGWSFVSLSINIRYQGVKNHIGGSSPRVGWISPSVN